MIVARDYLARMIPRYPTRRRHLPGLALALPALALLGACARIVPVAGYEFGVPLTVDRTAGLVNTYENEGSGSGSSENHTLRFGAAFESDSLLPRPLLLSPRLALAISDGRFTSDTFRVDDPTASAPISTRKYDVYSTLSVVQLDVPLLIDLGDVYAGVGPWTSYRVTSGFIQTEYIELPEDFTYDDGSTSRTTRTGESLGSARLRFGMLASIGASVAIGSALEVRPELYGRLDVTSLASDLGLRRSLGAGVLLAIAPVPSTPAPIALVSPAVDTPRAETSRPRAPQASIELRLADDAKVSSRGTIERLEIPFAPIVRFESGSDRFAATATAASAARMTIDSLARMTPSELQSRALDVAALRLREAPTATATLYAGRSPGEDRPLAANRARAVRAYLQSVWGIDSARIRIARDESTTPEVRVALEPALSEPIVTRWLTRSYSAPRVALRHTIDAPAGVRYWEITLRQGGRVLARATDGDGDSILSADVTLSGGLLPVIAELAVVDSAGERALASDTLALRELAAHGPIERERRETVVAAGENPVARARTIAATIADGAVVTINRLEQSVQARGSATAARLAGVLLEEIQRRGIRIAGLRVAEEPTGNAASSEGALAGAVRVVVEQPYAGNGN